jgi:hypothetical protein
MIQTENKDFSRDISTKALINTNRGALVEHRFRQEQMKKYEELKHDVDTIKSDLILIKQFLEIKTNV